MQTRMVSLLGIVGVSIAISAGLPLSKGAAVTQSQDKVINDNKKRLKEASILEKRSDNFLRQVYDQVTADAIDQYKIVSRSGSAMDKCVYAGLVAVSYLQAKDERNYKIWRGREASDCEQAGLPR